MAITLSVSGIFGTGSQLKFSYYPNWPTDFTTINTYTWTGVVSRVAPFQIQNGNTIPNQVATIDFAINMDTTDLVTEATPTTLLIHAPNDGPIFNVSETSTYLTISGQDNNFINTVTKPLDFIPAYNPIPFRFVSTNISKPNFRYIFNVKENNLGATIGTFKITPDINYSGYIDITKVLSNFVTLNKDFNSMQTFNAVDTYKKYSVSIGEEYLVSWPYSNVTKYTGATYPQFSGYTVLNQTAATPTNTYVTSNQINITTLTTGPTATINGLHTILQVIDSTHCIIDAVWPSSTATTIDVSGSTVYADNRKTTFNDLKTITGMTVYNGVEDWLGYRDYAVETFRIASNAPISPDYGRFLTNMPYEFYATPSQDIFVNLNIFASVPPYVPPGPVPIPDTYNMLAIDNFGTITEIYGLDLNKDVVQTVNLCLDDLGLDTDNQTYYDFVVALNYVHPPTYNPVSQTYRVYIDKRCKIEDYEILFMDRVGSMVSYAFQLRAIERGTITRESSKKQIYYGENATLDLTDRGTTINNVALTKELTLNTNWMTDAMSVYFEELVTSPYTYVKKDGVYYSCVIKDSDFEVTRQKNKNLIKKTITIQMAMDNPINI